MSIDIQEPYPNAAMLNGANRRFRLATVRIDAISRRAGGTTRPDAKILWVRDPLLTIHHDDGGAVLATGEIDASTSTKLDETLSSLDPDAPAFVDLSAVTFMDSSGLRILIEHNILRADAHCRLTILDPSEPVCRLFRLTGLDGVFHVVTS